MFLRHLNQFPIATVTCYQNLVAYNITVLLSYSSGSQKSEMGVTKLKSKCYQFLQEAQGRLCFLAFHRPPISLGLSPHSSNFKARNVRDSHSYIAICRILCFLPTYLFISVCAGSPLLHTGFLQLWRAGSAVQLGYAGFCLQSVRSRHTGLHSCSTQAQQL